MYLTNVASSVCPILANSNFLAYKWRNGTKEVRHGFIKMSLIFLFAKTVKERGFFSDPWVASLAPLQGFFPPMGENELSYAVYSTICKAKWQSTVMSIPFMKNKLKKDLFHKINSQREKIKMNG